MNPSFLGPALFGLWLCWFLYWLGSGRRVKPARWRESRVSQLRHRVPLGVAAVLMAAPRRLPHVLTRRFLPPGPVAPLAGLALTMAGLLLAIWARRHLGRNWSAEVTVKEDHALVRSGPYARVRHPIYSGLLLAMAGTAVAVGEWRGIVAVLLVLLAFVLKSRVEEERMRETFPEYEAYRRESAALIPFVY
jgi:protein-S-isoprenylcysteine O-methyltransferase Ste14